MVYLLTSLVALMQAVHMNLNTGLLTYQLSWLTVIVLCTKKCILSNESFSSSSSSARWDIRLPMQFPCIHEIKLKTRHDYLPLAIFVCLYQHNIFWYHQDPYIPTGTKLYLQKPKCTHTVIMTMLSWSSFQNWNPFVEKDKSVVRNPYWTVIYLRSQNEMTITLL